MADFVSNVMVCKCIRTTRLFQSVYDTVPSTVLLPEGAEFYSRKQYVNGSFELFYISSSNTDDDVPAGYWCPATVLQAMPIFEANEPESTVEATGATSIHEEIIIKASGAKVYSTYESKTAESNGLMIGDRLMCDKKIDVVIDGAIETRYHIAQSASEDQTVVNMWITLNRAVQSPEGVTVQYHNPNLYAKTLKMARDTSSYAAGNNTVENNPNAVNTPGGNTVEIPDFNVEENSAGNDDVVINQMSMDENMADLYDAYGYDYSAYVDSSMMNIPIGRMIFVHGMPFQYTHITDRRDSISFGSGYSGKSNMDTQADQSGATASGDVDAYGRSFAKEIAANMPIVVIAPGKPKFLTSVKQGVGGYASETINNVKNTFLPMFNAQSDTEFGGILENLNDIEGDYNYYSMEVDTAKYYKYVNSLCRTSAQLMGLSNVRYHGHSCSDFDWGSYNTAAEQDFSIFEQVMGLSAGVSFAFDPQSSVSDTIQNSTSESQFASFFNDLSSKAREYEFITGYSGSGLNEIFDSANYVQQATEQLNTGALAGLQNVVDRIKTWGENTLHGMNIRFPEIWGDSSHSRSYDIDMHFVAPYATNFCKWRYVLVPFFHIFALAAPKSDKNTSQYSAPFLIRAYSKGYFNVEMGIIESITWKRFGDGDMISEDGIPTQIDVSISFKDLYHTLSMTEFYGDGLTGNIKCFMNNTGLMDLIGTMSGVNMNRVSIGERLALFASSQLSVFGSLGSNFMASTSQKLARISNRLRLYGV